MLRPAANGQMEVTIHHRDTEGTETKAIRSAGAQSSLQLRVLRASVVNMLDSYLSGMVIFGFGLGSPKPGGEMEEAMPETASIAQMQDRISHHNPGE